jgi:hypothetical protein
LIFKVELRLRQSQLVWSPVLSAADLVFHRTRHIRFLEVS